MAIRPTWDTVWRQGDDNFGTTGDWAIVPADAETLELTRLGEDPYSDTVHEGNTGGFATADELGTAVILALMTDARLPDYMIGQFGFTAADQHEWHGNTFGIEENEERLGSLLWTLRRAPACPYTCRMAEHFAAAALQTLVRQKKVSSFEVYADITKPKNMLTIFVRAFAVPEREWVAYLWPLQ